MSWGLAAIALAYGILSLILVPAVPVGIVFVATMLAGFGIGLAYSPLSQAVLLDAPADAIGAATSGLQLCDTLGVSLGIGLSGVVVAAADRWTDGTRIGVGVAWAISVFVALFALVPARRVHGPALTTTSVTVTGLVATETGASSGLRRSPAQARTSDGTDRHGV